MANKTETATLELIVNGDVANKSLRDLQNGARALWNDLKNLENSPEEFAKKAENYRIVQEEIGKITAEIKGTQTAWDNFKESAGSFGAGFLGGEVIMTAIEKITEFGSESVKAFRDAQAQAELLDFAIKNIAGGDNSTLEQFKKQAEELEKTTIFSHVAIENAQTMALNVGLNKDKVVEIMPLITEFAAQNKLDLAQAMEFVIKGMEGSTKGLKNLGITFEKTGTKMGDLNAIMQQMTRFLGANAGALETDAGRMKQLDNSTEVAKERLGAFLNFVKTMPETFLGAIIGIFDKNNWNGVNDAAEKFQKHLAAIKNGFESTAKSTDLSVLKTQVAAYQAALTDARAKAEKEADTAKKQQLENAQEELQVTIGTLSKIINEREKAALRERDIRTLTIAELHRLDSIESEDEIKRRDEALKKQKKFNEDTLKLQKELEDATVNSIDDEFIRETAKLKNKHDQKVKEINDTKADATVKNNLLLALDTEYTRENEDLQKKHAKKIQDEFDKAAKEMEAATIKEGDIINKENKKRIKQQEEDLKAQTAAEIVILQQKRVNNEITEQQYLEQLEKIQINGDKRRLAILQQGSDEYIQLKDKIGKQEIALAQRTAKNEEELFKVRLELANTFITGFKDILNADIAHRKEYGSIIKALALGEVAINLQRELSAIAVAAGSNPLNSVTFGTAGATQYSIQSAIAIAKAGFETQKILAQQFAAGGPTTYSGELNYSTNPAGFVSSPTYFQKAHDRYIAGEAGREWIAPNWMLEKPATANIIGMLENMRVRGYASGGFSNDRMIPPGSPQPAQSANITTRSASNNQTAVIQQIIAAQAQQNAIINQTLKELTLTTKSLHEAVKDGVAAKLDYHGFTRDQQTIGDIQGNAAL